MAQNIDVLAKGWYSEISPMWQGQAQTLKVKEVLHSERTKFQDALVFESEAWGRVFTLDGAIQLCDKDEFAYHEMMAHVPLYAHPKPKRVLIVGGGDGGVLREVLKHPDITHVDLVDIDERVPEISKKYFPKISCSFADPRSSVHIEDCAIWIKDAVKRAEAAPGDETVRYDAVITDSSDPDGPASSLFGAEFYADVQKILNPGAVVVAQGENIYIHMDLISDMVGFLRGVGFKSVGYAGINIPSYPSGSIGALVATNREEPLGEPVREPTEDVQAGLQYYSPAVHRAAFVLPEFARRRIAAAAPKQ